MKLVYKIILRISACLLVILSLWALFFYKTMMDEVNDEVDDALEYYSEELITRVLAGRELPSSDNGTNNSYYLQSVDKEYAENHPRLSYSDEMVYIEGKRETEPARILKTVFRRADGSYSELTVMTPSIEKHDLREAIANWMLILFAAVLIAILSINAWIISRSMRPLYRLLRWLDHYNVAEQVTSLDNPTQVSEFKRLNETIDRFSKRNKELFEQQKRFIGDASHELQTPLAICQNRLEMLCNTDLSEEQLGEIIKTLQTLEHLSQLNKSLLLLSKIDNKQFPECTNVEINRLVRQALTDYRRIAAELSIKVEIREEGMWQCLMNEALARALVYNLIKNAILHNVVNGCLDIVITGTGIYFMNTGVRQELDAKHIFDRFYKIGDKTNSTGLGLAIVAAICKLYNLSVEYRFAEGKHIFCIESKKKSV